MGGFRLWGHGAPKGGYQNRLEGELGGGDRGPGGNGAYSGSFGLPRTKLAGNRGMAPLFPSLAGREGAGMREPWG